MGANRDRQYSGRTTHPELFRSKPDQDVFEPDHRDARQIAGQGQQRDAFEVPAEIDLFRVPSPRRRPPSR